MDYKQEAIERMKRRDTRSIQWTLKSRQIRFRYIQSTAARNWDGTGAGAGNDPSAIILEKTVWVAGQPPRYTNWW